MKTLVNRIGYKGFNVTEDGTLYCRDMYFEVGKTATITGELRICENGIHFCWNLNDVDNYYDLRTSVICEVEPVGHIIASQDGTKCCTDKLKIVRMLTKEEVLKITNTGNWNTGNWNTGNWNTGNCNTGNWNTGDCNTGNCNTGNCNTGNWNTGNWNTGNWNTGFFNQEEHHCYIFDTACEMTPSEFRNSVYYKAMYSAPFILTEWIDYSVEEIKNDKAKELIGGYLKTYSWTEACNNWWSRLTDANKDIIKSIPGFTEEKFKNITGIKNI